MCSKCKNEIPALRVKALPNTTTCVSCSDTQKKGGVFYSAGKTEYGYHTLDHDVAVAAQSYVRKRHGANTRLSHPTIENNKDNFKNGEYN